VSHVVNGVLSGSPLSVCIGHWGVLGEDTGHIPVEQIGVVSKRLGVEGVIVHDNGSVVSETSANTSDHEPGAPDVSEAASSVEILDWELTDNSETEDNTDLSTGSVTSPVEVRTVNRSGDFLHLAAGEPGSKDSELALSLGSPGGHGLLKSVLRHTKTDQIVILNVLGNLRVNLTSLQIIIGVLLLLGLLPARSVVHLGMIKRNFGIHLTHLLLLL